jgi:hypothetical protein
MPDISHAANWENHIGYYNWVVSDMQPVDNDNEETRIWKQAEQASARAMIEIIYELKNMPEFSSLSVRRSFRALTLHALGTDFILMIGAPNPGKGVYVVRADDLNGEDIPEMHQQLSGKDLITLLKTLFKTDSSDTANK